jgi:hypothetical protein
MPYVSIIHHNQKMALTGATIASEKGEKEAGFPFYSHLSG